MKKLNVETTKSKAPGRSNSKRTGRMISDEEVLQRAFEISHENGNSTNEFDNWVRAEAELR